MAMVLTALGLSPLGNDIPATDPAKREAARALRRAGAGEPGRARRHVQALTPTAFRNAARIVAATAGSTNAVLHLLAIAHEAGVALTLRISRTPRAPRR